MNGIGTDPEEPARADLYRWATIAFTDGVPDIVHDDLTKKLDALDRAVAARTREQVAQEIETADSPAPWRLAPGNVNRAWIDSRDSVKAAHIARNGTKEQS